MKQAIHTRNDMRQELHHIIYSDGSPADHGLYGKGKSHFSASNLGAVKAAINLLIGRHVKEIGGLNPQKAEERLKGKNKDIGVAFSSDGLGKQRITDKYGTIGSVTDNHDKGERRYSFDSHKMAMHKTQATGSDKKIAKAEKKEENQKNGKNQSFVVYRIDDEGNYAPEDHVMGQYLISYDDEKTNGHVDILMQVFTVDRAYVTKDELKKIKKENKMKMTYQNLQQFERVHKIPAVPADLQKRINEVVK